ncbi:MAG: cytochrome c maturation protein CcmE [Candidatus Geothermarchaeales archaeon]
MKMRIKPIHLILSSLVVFGVLLSYDALTSYVNPYLTVSQVAQNPGEYHNQEVQIIGFVANGSVQISGSNLSFLLADEASDIRVTYGRGVPQNFQEGIQVVVMGSLTGANHVTATNILTKCPSKYESAEGGQSLNPVLVAGIAIGVAAIAYASLTMLRRSK